MFCKRCSSPFFLLLLVQLLFLSCQSAANFSEDPYEFSIPENSPPGSNLGNIYAIFSNSSSTVSYHITSGNRDYIFSLNDTSGIFSSNASLDFESSPSYVVAVEARSGQMSANTFVTVKVIDVDDESPVCVKSFFHIYVTENTSYSPPTDLLTLPCTDLDSDVIYYNFVDGNDETIFQLINSSLYLAAPLNYSSTSSYNISIRVSDNSTASHHVNILVQVLPLSQLPPVFTQNGEYGIVLSEDHPVGPIYQVTLAPHYTNTTEVVEFSIVSGDSSGKFSINSATGLLSIQSSLDRELISSYSLSVMAFDQSVFPLTLRTALATVNITVLDVNDNAPTFNPANPSVVVSNDSLPSTLVTTLLCTDADSGRNGTIASYSLDSPFFRIDPIYGTVYINSSLPFFSNHYLNFNVPVTCSDSGSPPLSGADSLLVSVRQSNLYEPNFATTSAAFHVLENIYLPGRHLFEVTATDLDSDFEGEVSYAVTGGADGDDFFVPVPSIGHVHTHLVRFDREKKANYSLVITATDGALDGYQKSSSLLVIVLVSDENDNSPVFSRHSYFTSIHDNNTAGMPLPAVSCSDPDSGSNGRVEYHLVFSPSSVLSVNASTGAVQLGAAIRLASESARVLTSYVVCRDGGVPLRSDTASYALQVVPANEYPPVFQRDNYTASTLQEDSPLATFVIQVTAVYASVAGRQLLYSLRSSPGSNHFSIDQSSGNITVNSRLNATQFPTYELNVQATAANNLSDETTVYVPIFNVNEDAPIVIQVTFANDIQTVLENSPPGVPVAHVQCLDVDDILPDNISYHIDPASLATQEFVVNASGMVATGPVPTDCEAVDRYDLVIVCSDNESPPRTARTSIRIMIGGVNEFSPYFTRSFPYYKFIDEDTPLYTEVFEIPPAMDDDCGSDGEIRTYFLTRDPIYEGLIFPWFNVTADGRVFTIDYLDGEVVPFRVLSLTVEVAAMDNGNPPKSSLGPGASGVVVAKVTIRILNLNDKPPVFNENNPIQIIVDENQSSNITLHHINCTDPDNLDNVSINSIGNIEPFSVSNGNIFLDYELDYEQSQQHTFYISCSDSNFTTDIQVSVLVRPVNDNPVSFESNFYSFNLSRTATPGETIGTLVITDHDIDELSLPAVRITDFTSSYNPITVNHAGVLSLALPLLPDINDTFYLSVSVDDGRFNDTALVQVSLVEGNLNSPEFEDSYYIIEPFFDSTPVGTPLLQLVCTDRDFGSNGEVDFQITHAIPQEDFSVGSDGVVRVLNPLNASLVAGYNLVVRCFDHGVPVRFNNTVVSFFIIGGNVCPPVFILTESYSAIIPEDAMPGTMIGQVFTTDCDVANQPGPIYSTLSHHSQFFVDSIDGKIYVKGPLDRETEAVINLIIVAQDPTFNSSHVFRITLRDVNDNSPRCSPTEYFVRIPESSMDGRFILTLICSDADNGTNGELTYLPITVNSPFSILSYGSVFLNSSALLHSRVEHEFQVRVRDGGAPSLSSVAAVYVSLAPDNLFAPQFQGDSRHPAPINISELTPLGSLLFTFLAIDNDTGPAESSVRYGIESGNLGTTFQLHPEEGALTLNLPPDASRTSQYVLRIAARDQAALNPRTAYTMITIDISAVNRFPPACSAPQYSLYVEENRVGPFLALECSDADGTSVLFSIDSGDTSLFRINASGSLSLISALDYESSTSHSLRVRVSDGEAHILVTISVLVAPTNEFPPQFSSPRFALLLAENSSVPSDLVQLTASDDDRDNITTRHARVRYQIIAGNNDRRFTIGNTNGIVYLGQMLDFETTSEYNITVEATDVDFSTTAIVEISVINVNDVTPYFDDILYVFSINSSYLASSTVGRVRCFDTDFSNGVSEPVISLTAPNARFSLDSQSGIISLSLDASLIPDSIHDFAVSCWDGNMMGSSQVIVSIESDSPELAFEAGVYRFSVPESLPSGSVVGQVKVANASAIPVSFRIPDLSAPFRINSTGFFTLSGSLDFESQTSHVFSVEASANSFSIISATIVIVTINDTNDNPPYFVTAPIFLSMEESTPEGTVLLQITCQDSDANENGQTYVVISRGNENGFFSLTPSGSFQLNSSIDYESTDPTISLELTCSDRGSPSNSVSTNLTYHLLPTNEDGPTFRNLPYQFSVRESAQIGASLYRVQAHDPDIGSDHNSILYGIRDGGSVTNPFLITLDGDILLASSLDHESVSSYMLQVTAVDRGQQEAGIPNLQDFTDATTINVTVIDVNEYDPEFSSLFYLATIDAGVLPNTFVSSVNCTDRDEGGLFSPLYSLSGPLSASFSILRSGAILTNASILHQAAPSYLLTLSCLDQGDPVRSAESSILINVRDLSALCPRFSQTSSSVQLPESAPAGTLVARLNATIPDRGARGISYSLLTPLLPFRINQSTGEVYTASQLDFESDRFFALLVLATDQTFNGSCNSTASILVGLINVNEHSPIFSQLSYSASISEGFTVGRNILPLSCSDSDDSAAGTAPLVRIESGDLENKFSIQSQNLVLTSSLDIESRHNYTLLVSCTDRGPGAPLSASSQAVLTLRSVNEFAPLFANQSYRVAVSENAAIDTEVLTLSATDRDQFGHNSISYAILSGNEALRFLLRGSQLIVSDILDFEISPTFLLNISAADSSDPSEALVSFAEVFIQLVDENDNPPVLLPPVAFLSVESNVTLRTALLRLTCTDADLFQNASLILSIESGNNDTRFLLGSDGQLLVDKPLNLTTNSLYTLAIICRDNSSNPKQDSGIVVVSVVERVSEDLLFLNTPYAVSIADATPVGSSVFSVAAEDPETGTSDHLQFSLLNQDQVPFVVNQNTGQILTVEPLVPYSGQTYALQLQVTDSNRPTRIKFEFARISIDRTSNLAPAFQRDNFFLNASELSAPGTELALLNCSDANSDLVRYSILDGNYNGSFSLSEQTGRLAVKAPLDFESRASYSLTILCEDDGFPALSATAAVHISIGAENEHAPRFPSSGYSRISLNEDVIPGTELLGVLAADADSGPDGIVTYSIIEGDTNNSFVVGSSSGRIQVSRRLDFEQRAAYQLKIEARDNSLLSPRSSSVLVEVQVVDVNDNCPQFLGAPYFAQLPLFAAANHSVIRLSCSDADSGELGRVNYSLGGSSQLLRFFKVDSDGTISLVRSLPVDSTQVYSLTLICSDNAPLSCSVSSTLTVTRSEGNLSPPLFPSPSYSLSLSEAFPLLATFFSANATDADSGTNGQITYSIATLETDMFSIDPKSGGIYLLTPLDFEKSRFHNLTILATDGTPLSPSRKFSQTSLSLLVTDVNDNRPFCGHLSFTATLPRSAAIGSIVISLNCSDADTGPGGLRFRIAQGDVDNIFAISNLGVLTIASPLPALVNASYSLTIEISDSYVGDSVQTSAVQVLALLASRNDFCPQFSKSEFSRDVREDTPVGTTLLIVLATDQDIGLSGQVSYVIAGNADALKQFSVVSSTGEIILLAGLDRESASAYTFTIEASDGDIASPCVNQTVVSISITDANDMRPCLSNQFYPRTIFQQSPVNSIILTALAEDQDLGSNSAVVYSLIPINSPLSFEIDPSNGSITLVEDLAPLQPRSLYQYFIQATDRGSPALSCASRLSIYVTRHNTYAPLFQANSHTLFLSEGSLPPSALLQLNATDRDSRHVSFHILSGNEDSLFHLDPDTGVLSLLQRLDFEAEQEHRMVLQARDSVIQEGSQMTDTTKVTIYVSNLNDNAPRFDKNHFSAVINASAGVGTFVLDIVCTDSDLAPHNDTVLSISSGDSNGLFILSQNGTLSTAKTLDTTSPLLVEMTVTCSDGQWNATAPVFVIVAPLNMAGPVFSRETYSWSLPEHSQLGASFAEVSASSHNTSTILFRIENGNNIHKFAIDPDKGIVQVINPLDRELTPEYLLSLSATSGGARTLAFLRITLIDINDHHPVVSLQPRVSYPHAHSPVGTLLASISCSDADQGANAELSLFIATGDNNNSFHVTPGGALVLNGSLSPDSVRTLIVSCSDAGNPSRSSTALLSIEPVQPNRFSPEFLHDEYVVNVLENANVSSELVNVAAVDLDLGLLGNVTYSIASGNELNLFSINPITGCITLKSSLDFESAQSHHFSVLAKDGDDGVNPVRSSTAFVTVNVFDINDNAPRFQSVAYSAHISINTTVGSELLQVLCTDPDSLDNGEVSYSFTTNPSPFSLYNGSISLALPIAATTPERISLVLQCRDHGAPSLVSTAALDVFVRKDSLSPLFSQSVYQTVLSEHTHIGYELPVNISAQDLDSGNNGAVVYGILSCEIPCPISIHRTSGVVSVAASLDFESSPSLLIFLQAIDDGTFSHESVATLRIDILNENDNSPEFDQEVFSVIVTESAPLNSALLSVQCTDLDADLLTYNISEGLQGKEFAISESGVLLVSGKLDYEARSSYSLTIHCQDGGIPVRTDTATVHISILNSNEYAPTFTESIYNFTVSESLQFGSHVFSLLATDRDSGSLEEIQYSIVGGNLQQTFSIVSTEGMVFLTGTLDYETTPAYLLTVFATDRGGLSGRTYVHLAVENVNDNAPRFVQSVYPRVLSVRELAGRNVVELRCSDLDGSVVRYAIESGNTGNHFNISSLTGLVAVSRDLTSSNPIIILTVTCSDIDTHPPARAVVSISILGDSDCPVQFSQPHYSGQVSEGAPLHHSILTLSVTGPSSDISYAIASSSLPFSIDSSGLIALSVLVDAEDQSQYTFDVRATPNDVSCADPPHASVTISVQDLNEFAPVISPTELTVTLPENFFTNGPIAQFGCLDPDASNGSVSFIETRVDEGGALFNLNTETGQVGLLQTLDYEQQILHTLTVRCRESSASPKTGSAILNIMVSPENEFPPRFPLPSYQLVVSESSLPGVSIGRITATDEDSPLSPDGRIQYFLLNSSLFTVSADGDISVQSPLDRETEPVVNFTLLATDRGNSSLTAYAAVSVLLLDVNDNPPQFHPLLYAISLDGSRPISGPVASIRCTDPDEGSNAMLVLSLRGSNLSYALHNVTTGQGEINATLTALSPPKSGLSTLQLVCTDAGNASLSSTAQVSILVSSACTSPSFLTTHYSVTVREDLSPNSVLINTSSAYDSMCPHQFHILSGAAQTFEIHEALGYIYTTNSLDFEAVTSYRLTLSLLSLTATGVKSATATAVVTVSDTNDNLPQIRPTRLTVTIREDSPLGQEVAAFSCSDLDAGAGVRLSIESGDDLANNKFSITQQGEVSLLNSLDFESTRVYDIAIVCSETTASPPNTATALLTVLVAAANDHDPMFLQSTYSSMLAENASIGTTVVSLSASDGDFTALHNKTLFALTGPNSNLFRVTSDGSVITAELLDAEASLGLYQFSALAYNEAPGASTATATLSISLTDVNESPPTCGGGLINLQLEARTYSNQVVGGVIMCTDQDISTPTFSARLTPDSANDVTLQLVAAVTGSSLSLSLTGTLVYPRHVTPNQYTLMVSDGGSPVLSANTLIYLRVTPPPGVLTFFPSSTTRSAPEDFPVGDIVLDSDPFLSGANKDQATYSITSPTLSINSQGEVRLATALDYESSRQHSAQITASISGSSLATFSLLVTVQDVNDNSPQFSAGNIITIPVSEATRGPVNIYTLRATDADSGSNGMIAFSLESSSSPLFAVGTGGGVTLTGTLDREHTPQYSLQVRASDQGSPPLYAVAIVVITVTDVNDNPPRFLEDSLTLSIPHTLQSGSTFHTFQVSDPDLNPIYSFTISEQIPDRNAFGVDASGDLSLRGDLINTPSQTFSLRVRVGDGIFADSISVQVSVTNLAADVELSLRENAPLGTLVWDARGYLSGNYTPTPSATFALSSGNFAGKFDIGTSAGLLTTIGDIDYEEEFVYTFVVQITDPASSVITAPRLLVYLLVLDENDNDPTFNHSLAPIQLQEGEYIQPYELVRAVASDRDSGVYAQLLYRLVTRDSGREAAELPFYFLFDGRLFAQGVVDREAYPQLDLLVLVKDASSEPRNATAPIYISILDVNDNPPSFTNLTSPIELSSDLPTGYAFSSFSLSDPDQGENGTVQFSMQQTSPSSPSYFHSAISSTDSGLRVSLIIAEPLLGLPAEVFDVELRLTGSDLGSPSLISSREVTVSVVAADLLPRFRSDLYWLDVHFSSSPGAPLLTLLLVRALPTILFSIDEVDEGEFRIDAASGTLSSTAPLQRVFTNYNLQITATNKVGGKSSSASVVVNTVQSAWITELLINVSFSDFVEGMETHEQQLKDRVTSGNTLYLIEHHLQDGVVNASIYVVQGVWFDNGTSPALLSPAQEPKPFISAELVCELYFNPESSPDVIACEQRAETAVATGATFFHTVTGILVVFILLAVLVLAGVLCLCLGVYVYYKRREDRILLDETIFEHPYMIARPLGAYEMQEELKKLGRRGRVSEAGYGLTRGREYNSSDENIDETFLNQYASSDSSMSVYGQDYSKFEQMEAWQKYRNMGPRLREMVERWRDGDNKILEDSESKGEVSV